MKRLSKLHCAMDSYFIFIDRQLNENSTRVLSSCYMPGATESTLQVSVYLILTTTLEVNIIVIPILQMAEPRHRMVK